jgi:hypothetical protein
MIVIPVVKYKSSDEHVEELIIPDPADSDN